MVVLENSHNLEEWTVGLGGGLYSQSSLLVANITDFLPTYQSWWSFLL